MSNIYNLEPPTKGKVTLKTTVGDLDIELWPKEAPKAVRNFVQLCLEGYYDGCIFHRIIKDFMVQTGDPTGTGEGGETIYDGPFKDEFHSRLRFNHRGLVACANRNEPHSNGSQFFITLDKCDWLDRKNTIFGKIVGETIYNLIRMNDMEVDESNDRPVDPPKIVSVDVLWNPFEDIVPRITPEERIAQEQFKKAAETRKERTSRKRNLALLSFGEEAEEEEHDLAAAAAAASKIKSAHEVLKGDSKLLAAEETPEEVLREQQQRAAALQGVQDKLRQGAKRSRGGSSGSSSDDDDGDHDSDDEGKGSRRKKSKARSSTAAAAAVAERVKAAADKADKARAARAAAAAAAAEDGSRSRGTDRQNDSNRHRSSGSSDDDSNKRRSRERGDNGDMGKAPSAAAAAGGVDGGSSKPKSKEDEFYQVKSKQGAGRVRVDDSVADAELLKDFELSRQKYKTRKQQVGNRQKDTMARLAAFTDKLRTNNQQQKQQREAAAAEAAAAAAKREEEAAAKEQQLAEAAAAAAKDDEKAATGGGGEGDEAYDGKVRTDIDHRSYMPAAWRVDDYLNQQEDDEDDLASLRQHKLEFSKAPGAGVDAMARSDNLDDYVVFDPLLEAAKGKFSRSAQREKKKQTQWAGRGQG